MLEELSLGRCDECCLYRPIMMIDRTECLGSSQTYVWIFIYQNCIRDKFTISVFHVAYIK